MVFTVNVELFLGVSYMTVQSLVTSEDLLNYESLADGGLILLTENGERRTFNVYQQPDMGCGYNWQRRLISVRLPAGVVQCLTGIDYTLIE